MTPRTATVPVEEGRARVLVVDAVIQWVVAPAILLAVLAAAALIPSRLVGRDARRSARAGFWAGIGVVAIAMLVLPDGTGGPLLVLPAPDPLLSPIGAVTGLAVGVALPGAYLRLRDTPTLALLAAVLSATAGLSLVVHVLFPHTRPFFVASALVLATAVLTTMALSSWPADRFATPLVREP